MKYFLIATGVLLFAAGLFMPTGWYELLPWPDDTPEPIISGLTLFRLCLGLDGILLVALALSNVRFARIEPSNLFRVSRPKAMPPSPKAKPSSADATPSLSTSGGATAGAPAWTLPALILITALALALRVYKLGADLWVDEILTVTIYVQRTPIELLTVVADLNNHLLNTLLIKASIGLFGETEWAVRLPVMIFGVATIPAVYWVARLALSNAQSLGAALLLAVSYHHIFFSQNARGYIPYVLFSLLATGALVRALETDAPKFWFFFIVATLLNFMSLLNSGFVFIAHALVGAIALIAVRRGGGRVGGCVGGRALPLLKRLICVFGVTGYLGFHLYCLILPYVLSMVGRLYDVKTEPYSALFLGRVGMLMSGIVEGFGGAVFVLIPVFAFIVLGLVVLARRHWLLAAGLIAPNVVMAGVVGAFQLRWQPRIFIFAIPLASILIVAGSAGLARLTAQLSSRLFARTSGRASGKTDGETSGESVGEAAAGGRGHEGASGRGRDLRFEGAVGVGWVLAFALLSLWPLRRYYSMPKQDFRGSIARLVELRGSGEPDARIATRIDETDMDDLGESGYADVRDAMFVGVDLSALGLRYYGEEFGLVEGVDYYSAFSVEALDRIAASFPNMPIYLLTTLHAPIRRRRPGLLEAVEENWEPIDRFDGTMGGGDITVWAAKRRDVVGGL